jgi:hypothetical protein
MLREPVTIKNVQKINAEYVRMHVWSRLDDDWDKQANLWLGEVCKHAEVVTESCRCGSLFSIAQFLEPLGLFMHNVILVRRLSGALARRSVGVALSMCLFSDDLSFRVLGTFAASSLCGVWRGRVDLRDINNCELGDSLEIFVLQHN